MAGPTSVTLASALSNFLAGLTPNQLGKLGNHLSQSNEMNALLLVDRMEATPALTPVLFTTLSTIPNLPAQVLTWVEEAMVNPATASQSYAQAKAALQAAAVAPGLLGSLGL